MLKRIFGCLGLSGLASAVGVAFSLATGVSDAIAADPCASGSNPVVCENSKPGTPSSEWDIGLNGDLSIQGFATDMSVNVGGSIGFKVDTDAAEYSLLIYRMGWYGGDGARLVDTLTPSATLPQVQPACLTESSTYLLDCGNWGLSATWNVPGDAVSGVYIARLRRPDTGGDSHVVFVVRDDSRTSDVLFQTSDTTWQAYNSYGDRSLYIGGPVGRAYKVSYNRPMFARGGTPDGRDSFFGSEYAMIRWLERNGYDVSYLSGVDTDRADSALLLDHDVFLSVGHDEYWSGRQRANVEAARDAGVNLVFASGNEVYWKTRWEPSIDGSGTDYRTLVSYKETRNGAKIDPSPVWTGTWRDPRFSPPSDGGRPENELTGTLFTVNCCTYALKVPAEYGDLRFWRDTSVASLQPGSEAVFPLGTLGYEWDEDLDNGFRPPGAFRMSSTTETVQERLIDYGQITAVEEATHHLMMYRAASGALVFGAGTVQWSWGLDTYHDGRDAPVDPDMQQATVNVLADMGVQPQTLENGLVTASESTDTGEPVVSISSPSAGASFRHGELVTVSGSAIDSGGVVAAVEVSLDGGSSWHPASGRGSWSYSGSPSVRGSQTFMARAVDDSGNLGSPEAVTVDVGCPCTIFGEGPLPRVDSFASSSPLELGVRFRSDIDGFIAGVRFYKGPASTGTHTGSLWSASGTRLATGTFVDETSSGWQELTFAQPVAITAGTNYVASYFAPSGYVAQIDGFASQATSSPPLRALRNSRAEPNGLFVSSPVSTFPNESFGSTNYWVDVVFSDVTLPDTNPPAVVATTPVDGTSSVSVDTLVSLIVDETIDPESMLVKLVDGDATAVQGSLAYDEASRTVTFTPFAPLAYTELYTVTASFTDVAGNAMAEPVSFSFETSRPDGAVAALWNDSDVPAIADANDASSVEVGTKFVANQDLDITGVRFYKSAANTGAHVGSLWNASGVLLSQVSFGSESASGWQEATFPTPVRITAGQTYVASYLAPNGHYSVTNGYFDQGRSSGPLTAPASAAVGGNGVFAYGNGGFPASASNGTSYWVSPVYERLPDTQAPRLASTTPADGSSSVALDTAVSAVFDEPVDATTVTVLVTDGVGAAVTGSVAYDSASATVSFVPSAPLAADSVHTVEVSASDPLGNTSSDPSAFSFRTRLPDGAVAALWNDSDVPGVIDSGDTGSIEVGTKFIADRDLDIIGIRFYKSVANTGTHVGSLWDAAGVPLAQVTFENESSSGWQQATFSEPVRVTKARTYVVSYWAPNGHYSVAGEYFDRARSDGPLTAPASSSVGGNGVFAYGDGGFPTSSFNDSNYWVTPVYALAADLQPPTLVSTAPVSGASSVAPDAVVSAVFDEPLEPDSIDVVVTDAAGTVVDGSVSYDESALTVTFSPSASLATKTVHVVEVSVTDLVGNATASPLVFSFETSLPNGMVAALWNDSEGPDTADSGDPESIEVGTKFVADRDLAITGVRFYKSALNTGTHVGSLWTGAGALLARATFGDESSAGWQEVTFDAPVSIQTGQRYVVSYLASNGHYSATVNYFDRAYSNGPLTAPASENAGGNGVYAYGGGGFPTSNANRTNYWVTPTYEQLADTQPPALIATVPVDDASSVAVDTELSAVFDEPIDAGSIAIVVTNGAGAEVAGSVAYDAASSTASFLPSDPLSAGSVHTVEVSVTDVFGNATPAPLVFSFETSQPDGAVAALWSDSTVPSTVDSGDGRSIEVGTKFVADRSLDITGIRFFKSVANTGAHVGSLWDSSGASLAQVVFGSESSTGWQQATFAAPVQIVAGETYVASYLAPNGHYSATTGYFDQARSSGPLTAPASAAVGGNGVFSYGSGGFPTSSAGRTNYWVTAVYEDAEDQTPPVLVETTPTDGSSSVALDGEVSATFDEPVNVASIAITVTDGSGTGVAGSVAYDQPTRTAAFLPSSPLAAGRAHTVEISASDIAGNATLAPLVFSFRTSQPDGEIAALWDDSVAPDVVDSGDTSSIEIGTKFVAREDLDIIGIRFYKSVANTGTHVGSLWNAAGVLLADVTFGDESSAGWQQASFSAPVRILAGRRYVVSYLAPEGHYSATGGYFDRARSSGPLTAPASTSAGGNGVYSYGDGGFPSFTFNSTNYWVTPVYAVIPPPAGAGEGLWDYAAVPSTIDTGDTNSIEIGTRFVADEDLDIVGLRFYKSAANDGIHVGSLWDASGALLAQVTFDDESTTGWQETRFPDPVRISAGEVYVASYLAPNGRYSASGRYFEQDYSSGPLTAPASTFADGNGVYAYGAGGFPSSSFNKTNYWITPVYELP